MCWWTHKLPPLKMCFRTWANSEILGFNNFSRDWEYLTKLISFKRQVSSKEITMLTIWERLALLRKMEITKLAKKQQRKFRIFGRKKKKTSSKAEGKKRRNSTTTKSLVHRGMRWGSSLSCNNTSLKWKSQCKEVNDGHKIKELFTFLLN